MNVSIEDIKDIEQELSITLTDIQRDTILNEYYKEREQRLSDSLHSKDNGLIE